MNSQPIFSLCHTTRRIPGWEKAAREWLEACDNPQNVEYVLSVDSEDVEKLLGGSPVHSTGAGFTFKVAVNDKRRCAVDGWNTAAGASTGKFLITVSDDLRPIPHWDTELLKILDRESGKHPFPSKLVDEEAVVWVNSGEQRDLMAFSLLTRKYYERYGYIFYPEYLGMFGDDDFTAQAIKDGVVIDCRKSLPLFEHLHPAHGTAPMDEVYEHQNRPEAYEVGRRIYERRWGVPAGHAVFSEQSPAPSKQRIAVCLPGEIFSKAFMRAWTQTVGFLLLKRNLIVTPIYGHCSNVYVSRQAMANSICDLPDKHDYVLWIDDDQVVNPQHVQWLFETLERYPNVDIVSGWTYIQDEETGITKVSAGKYTEDGSSVMCIPISEMQRIAAQGLPVEVEWTGFPVVLMRAGAIEKANACAAERINKILEALGEKGNPGLQRLSFGPIFTPSSVFGFTGEDVSFSINTKEAGGKILLDSRVFVEHMKLRAIRPIDAPNPANETPEVARQGVPEVTDDLGSIIGRFYVGPPENRVKRAIRRAREYTGV